MKHKHHGGPGPIPPANQPHTGPTSPTAPEAEQSQDASKGDAAFSEQDPKRRLGDYTTQGEHAFVQPGGRNAADGKPSNGSTN